MSQPPSNQERRVDKDFARAARSIANDAEASLRNINTDIEVRFARAAHEYANQLVVAKNLELERERKSLNDWRDRLSDQEEELNRFKRRLGDEKEAMRKWERSVRDRELDVKKKEIEMEKEMLQLENAKADAQTLIVLVLYRESSRRQ